MTTRLVTVGVLCLVVPAGALQAADTLVDPMQPPAGFRAPEPAPAVPGSETLVLQSVRVAGNQRSAMINGVTVKPGDRIGGAVVRRIADAQVVLQREGVEQVLTLYPGIEKRMADTARPRVPTSPPHGGRP